MKPFTRLVAKAINETLELKRPPSHSSFEDGYEIGFREALGKVTLSIGHKLEHLDAAANSLEFLALSGVVMKWKSNKKPFEVG